MSVIDGYLRSNARYAESFDKGALSRRPSSKLAIVTCMDARVMPGRILGLQEGEAHVIRNAGGVVGDPELRALAISQRVMGTEEIVLIRHTDCGMRGFDDERFKREIEEETGVRPAWSAVPLGALEAGLRESLSAIKASPFVPRTDAVRGFVYEVETGRLREVS